MTIKCFNKGCGKEYNSIENNCTFHPGAPLFHEGLKVLDFDEFLLIPGCTVGNHSNQPPPSAIKASDVSKESKETQPIYKQEDGKEVYGVKKENITPLPAPSSIMESTKEKVKQESELHDSLDAVISIGSKCKRKGCDGVYKEDSSRKESCVYHSGSPVFHEGSKGWSCCPRKVLEFDEFLKIKGCQTGLHRFTDVDSSTSKESESCSTLIECRRDWYQTPTHVILSIFAKKCSKEKTQIVFKENQLFVDIEFINGTKSKFHTDLFQPILPSLSTFEILSTKIEISLKKANGISWADIQPNSSVVSWTTFGTTGMVGTVGGKEPVIAGDAPIQLLKK